MSHIINPVAPYLSKFQGEWSILKETKKSAVKPNKERKPWRDASGFRLAKRAGGVPGYSWLFGKGAEVEVKHP